MWPIGLRLEFSGGGDVFRVLAGTAAAPLVGVVRLGAVAVSTDVDAVLVRKGVGFTGGAIWFGRLVGG
jgi:hypothetical protein